MSKQTSRHLPKTVSALGVSALLIASVGFSAVPSAVAADQAAAATTKDQALAAVDGNLGSLNQQAGSLNGQIGEVNGQISQLEAEQAVLSTKLTEKKALLRQTLREAYVAGDPSSIEVIASNQSFSGVVGQQHYRDRVSTKTAKAAKDVQDTQQQLDGKVSNAKQKRDGLVAMQADLNQKIETTKAQEAAKAALAAQSEAEFQKNKQALQQEQMSAAIATAPKASSSGGGMVHGNNPYTPGQCTWYVYNQTGRGQSGNAGQWPGGGSKAVGSILIMPPGVAGSGSVGHVGIIVGISGSGITIRDMNWAGPYIVTTHTVPNSGAYRYL
ncbi:CHAP domain-containing protein [Patescibacteria group bacterium]|nr:CHAP domain-containing protein [Patescibacteria group bacterium]